MHPIEYNAQLNTKPTILKFYTPWEFFVGLILTFSTIGLPVVFGVPPSFIEAAVVYTGYTLFLVYFKIGKPEGYLSHLIKHHLTPTVFRPGHKDVPYPVRPPLKAYIRAVARSPEELWAACQAKQRLLLESDLIPNGSYGGYLNVTDPEIKATAETFIAEGGVLSVAAKRALPETYQS